MLRVLNDGGNPLLGQESFYEKQRRLRKENQRCGSLQRSKSAASIHRPRSQMLDDRHE